MVRMVQQGSAWDQKHAVAAGTSQTTNCDLCGGSDADFGHIWLCPKLAKLHNELMDKHIPGIKLSQLHSAVKFGIAPAMAVDHNVSYWDGRFQTQMKKQSR